VPVPVQYHKQIFKPKLKQKLWPKHKPKLPLNNKLLHHHLKMQR
jgi:hypothetical protein